MARGCLGAMEEAHSINDDQMKKDKTRLEMHMLEDQSHWDNMESLGLEMRQTYAKQRNVMETRGDIIEELPTKDFPN